MKNFFLILSKGLSIALSIVLVSTVVVSAAELSAATTKQLSTNFTLVNMATCTPPTTCDATVNVSYFKTDGSPWSAAPDNTSFAIPGNFGQKIIAQYFDTTMVGGEGSVVIQSDKPLGAVVQILARNQVPSSGAYSGVTIGSSKYYAPLVQSRKITAGGLSNAQIMIQNIETTSQTVSVDFIPGDSTGNSYTKSGIVIPGQSTYKYDLSNETNLVANWTGSAVINAEAGKKVAVVVNLFAGSNTLTTYNAFPAEVIGKNWAVPLFTSRLPNGLSVSVSVQNLSGSTLAAGAIQMNCKSSISTPAAITMSNTTAVSNNQTYAFNPVTDTTIPGNWSGSCIINSTGNVVAIATLRTPGLRDDAAAYEAFNIDQSTDTTVVFPLMSKRQANGFATVATIQNLDSTTEAEVKLTYTPGSTYTGSQSPIEFTATIPPGGNLLQNLRFNEVPQIPDGWFGTLVVKSTNGRPLVGFVQLTNILGLAGDTTMANNAFTLP